MADKYYRLVCFVVDICGDVLRKYFIKLARTDPGSTYTSVDAYLSHRNRDVMQLFNNKKLRRDQYDLLYPSNSTADENQWDVSILVTLITELFATRLQPDEISSLKTEIRVIRNELQHNPNTGNIPDDDFDDYWGRLDSSVRLIAKNALDTNDQATLLKKINKVKCNHLPNLSDYQRLWHEEKIYHMLNILDEVQANTSILRQVTFQKPGPSGDKNKRIKVADDILARLQAGFESTMKELSGDFNPPSEVTDIRTKLRNCHHVVVTGCNNSRYFETALAAIKGMDYNYKRSVEMHTPSDWRHIDPEDVDLVLCKDPFGRISYDESKAKAMDDIFKSMVHSTKRDSSDKALDIVIVTDLKIMEECKIYHDHELLDEVVKVFIDTSSTHPADLTIECRGKGQYAHSSSLPVTRNNLGAMTEYFLKIYSCQVDDEIHKEAKKCFQIYKAIVLTGRKECSKTSIAVALASAYKEQQCLLLKKPHDIDKIDFQNICLVIIDEFAGKYRYEENEVYEWYNMFDHLYNAVIAGQMNVIITCERGKLEKCINEIGRHAILDHVVDVPLQKVVVKSEVTKRKQNPMQLKRGFSEMERSTQTEAIDLSVKRSRSMSSGLWSENREINIRINGDSQNCWISGRCILPSGEILLADYTNKKLKKLGNMYNVKCVCDLPDQPYDACYVGDNVAVVSLWRKLQFVDDTKYSMALIRFTDIGRGYRGLACPGYQMYVRDYDGSVFSYRTDGLKQQMIYSFTNFYYPFTKIAVSNDGSKLYFSCENELVSIDNNGNHLFTLNNEDIGSSSGVCVDDQGFVYVNGRNGNILQISKDGRTILQVITNLSDMTGARSRLLTFDRKNTVLIAAGNSDTIRFLKLR